MWAPTPTPVGPPCAAELAHHTELLLLGVEVAADAARPTAEGPQLLKGQPDRRAELLFLPDRGI